ncbi:MAG: glycosyltransferase family 1 protein [Ponticaulis sp.]|nr:glycosyltransferase family 1 protein [Ponticaulis sp.]|tara:strand:+ start:1163 stop:2326 length:1164 start_codon:yes stop_codon:yes gene_type:complete
MKIIHIITRLIRGGADENTVITCIAQADAGHDVTLIYGRDHSIDYVDTIPDNVRVVCMKELVREPSPLNDMSSIRLLMKLFKAEKPDVVHTHTSKAGFVGRLAAKYAKVPTIIHGVHIVPFENVGTLQKWFYLLAEKFAGRYTDAFINVSNGTREIYLDHKIGSADQHAVVHSGFDVSKFIDAQPPADWRERLELAPNAPKPPTAVMLAAFEPRKRQLEFLRICPSIIENIPDIQFVFCGEGPDLVRAKALVDELGISPNVKFLGFRKDPETIIAMADVCLLSSQKEGLPRVVMQYLSGNRPCIMTRLSGIEEVLKHDRNGLIIEPDDFDALADAVTRFFRDPELRERLSLGAQQSDLSSWDRSSMQQRTMKAYAMAVDRLKLSTAN